MSVSRARCSAPTQRACGARCDLPCHTSARCRWRGRTAGVRPRIDGDSKLRVQKKRLGSSTPHGAADDLRLRSSQRSRDGNARRQAHCRSSNKSNVDAFGRTTRCAFPNRLTALQQAIRLLWHITHIERSCCHSRDQHSGPCQLARLLLTCLTVIMQRNCVVGSVCCSEDTSLRGPNVFKN